MPSPTASADGVRLRPGSPADLEVCARICFEAFGDINRRHGFPPEMPAPEMTAGLMGLVLNSPHVYGVVAEKDGRGHAREAGIRPAPSTAIGAFATQAFFEN